MNMPTTPEPAPNGSCTNLPNRLRHVATGNRLSQALSVTLLLAGLVALALVATGNEAAAGALAKSTINVSIGDAHPMAASERPGPPMRGRTSPQQSDTDSTPEPTAEPTPEPTEEPTPEPTEKPTPEPTEEPTPEPTEEPTPVPTEEPTPEPTEEPTPEPTEEPTPEPTEEPGPEPTEEAAQQGEEETRPTLDITELPDGGKSYSIIIPAASQESGNSGRSVPKRVKTIEVYGPTSTWITSDPVEIRIYYPLSDTAGRIYFNRWNAVTLSWSYKKLGSSYRIIAFLQPKRTSFPRDDFTGLMHISVEGRQWGKSSGIVHFPVDADRPVLTVTVPEGPLPSDNNFTVTFDVTEPVDTFEENDILVHGGSVVAGSFAKVPDSQWQYTAEIEPAGDGQVSVTVAPGSFTDPAGHSNTGGSDQVAVGPVTKPRFPDPRRGGEFGWAHRSFNILENSPKGTLVGDPVTAVDLDGDSLGYSVADYGSIYGGDEDDPFDPDLLVFDFNPFTAQLSVGKDRESLDYESAYWGIYEKQHYLNVQVTDCEDENGLRETAPCTVDDTARVLINIINIKPPDAPARPAVTRNEVRQNTALDVSWTAPNDHRGAITGYQVQYREKDTEDWLDTGFTGTGTSTTIDSLTSGATYQVRVNATNAEGTSGWSPPGERQLLNRLAPNKVNPPTLERAPSATAPRTGLRITWESAMQRPSGPPEEPRPGATPEPDPARITGYYIEYRKRGEQAWTPRNPMVAPQHLSVTIWGLEPGTEYEARMSAANGHGQGDWSEPGSGTTNHFPAGTGTYVLDVTGWSGIIYNSGIINETYFDDRDGDALTPFVGSDPEGLVRTNLNSNGAMRLNVINPGRARVIYGVTDGYGGRAERSFNFNGLRRKRPQIAENSPPGTEIPGSVAGIGSLPLSGYSLSSSLQGLFTIDADTGVISVGNAAMDFESQEEYLGEVEYTVGADGQAVSRITIQVTDVPPPDRPDPPTLTLGDASTDVTWTAPNAHGQTIQKYELDYRTLGSDDDWTTGLITTDDGHGGTITSYTITGAGSYEARVRAYSVEGPSQWSDISGLNRTPEFPEDDPAPEPEPEDPPNWDLPEPGPNPSPDPHDPPTPEMGPPDGDGFDLPGADLSVPENSPAGTNVGDPIAATDPDGDTLEYRLTFETVPEEEDPNAPLDIYTEVPANFVINSASGQISVAPGAVLDFETGPTLYAVTVEASDRKDAQDNAESEFVADASKELIIGVTDVDEPPEQPDRPLVARAAMSSRDEAQGDRLHVIWTEPINTGLPSPATGCGTGNWTRAMMRMRAGKNTTIGTRRPRPSSGAWYPAATTRSSCGP